MLFSYYAKSQFFKNDYNLVRKRRYVFKNINMMLHELYLTVHKLTAFSFLQTATCRTKLVPFRSFWIWQYLRTGVERRKLDCERGCCKHIHYFLNNSNLPGSHPHWKIISKPNNCDFQSDNNNIPIIINIHQYAVVASCRLKMKCVDNSDYVLE